VAAASLSKKTAPVPCRGIPRRFAAGIDGAVCFIFNT